MATLKAQRSVDDNQSNLYSLQLQIMVESRVVCWMNLLLSFLNFCMQEFFELVCIVGQKRRIELEDNKDRLFS
jgi:hypothetical protein